MDDSHFDMSVFEAETCSFSFHHEEKGDYSSVSGAAVTVVAVRCRINKPDSN